MTPEDAEEYTQALGQVTAGGWRQIVLGERLGVPSALGLSTRDWVEQRLGGYVRMSIPERKAAAAELASEGMTQRQIADVVGVSQKTVDRDLGSESNDSGRPIEAAPGQDFDDVELPGLESDDSAQGSLPARQDVAEAILDAIDSTVAESSPPSRPRPPEWDPEERRQHEEEVRRVRIIEDARQEAKTIVTTVRSAVVTVVSGARLGERGLITRDMVAELRAALDLLEKEISDEE